MEFLFEVKVGGAKTVNEGVEVVPHPVGRISLQSAPFVVLDEARRRDLSARGHGAQLRHFGSGGRAVDCRECVVLVFAQDDGLNTGSIGLAFAYGLARGSLWPDSAEC